MTGKLIDSATAEPAVARPGQPVHVRATAGDLSAGGGIALTIDGMETHERWYQFAGAGEHHITVRAARDGVVEEVTLAVKVEGEPLVFQRSQPALPGGRARPGDGGGAAELAMLQVRAELGHPYTVRLSLGGPRAGRSRLSAPGELTPGSGLAAPAGQPAETYLSTTLDQAVQELTAQGLAQVVQPQALAGSDGPDLAAAARVTRLAGAGLPQPETGPGYRWEFGDGTVEHTNAPAVTHDYFPKLDPARASQAFTVTCYIEHAGFTVARTIALDSAYALCKRSGVIVPHVEAEERAVPGAAGRAGLLVVHNAENQPLTLTEAALVHHAGPGESPLASPQFVAMEQPIVLPAGTPLQLATYVPAEAAPAAPGFTVYYRGHGEDGSRVRFSAAYTAAPGESQAGRGPERAAAAPRDQPQAGPWDGVAAALARQPAAPARLAAGLPRQPAAPSVQVDRRTETIGVALGPEADTAARARVRSAMLTSLHSAGAAPKPATDPGVPRGAAVAGGVSEGQVCDPDNIPAADAASAAAQGLSCQVALQDPAAMTLVPGRFANALKGDVVINPDGPDIISDLLLGLQPPQKHNHSGIMTQNQVEITHCTATMERLSDHLDLIPVVEQPRAFLPGPLKYMWPGIITQNIDAAVNGEPWVDAEFHKTYIMQCFSGESIGSRKAGVVPPLVIKPAVESAEIRQKLGEVADMARAMAARVDAQGNLVAKSQAHYRLYGYTEPVLGLTQTAGPDAGWAAGTLPAVCSSFIWLCLRKHGVHLGGAGAPQSDTDGLFEISAEQRRAVGRNLFPVISEQAAEHGGWIGNILARPLGIADHIADQILNAFTCDDTSPDNYSRPWQTTGSSLAVAPEHILAWAGPDQGGLFGYCEPLIYRAPRWEQTRVFRWLRAGPPARLAGTVTAGGQPAAGARVQVYDGKSTASAADGSFTLAGVPQGTYEIRAAWLDDDVYYEARQVVDLNGGEVRVDLALQAPAAVYRLAHLTPSFACATSELLHDETNTVSGEQYWVPLNPARVAADQGLEYSLGEGHFAAYRVHLTEAADNSLAVALEGWIYDGAGRAPGTEKAHAVTVPCNVPAGGQVVVELAMSIASLLPGRAATKLTLLVGNEQDKV